MIAAAPLLWQLLFGQVTYYSQGMMEMVYEARLAGRTAYAVAPCATCIGMLAVEDCTLVGKYAYLTRPGQPQEGPFLITDCGLFATQGRVAEVDYQTARNWNMRAPINGVLLIIVDELNVAEQDAVRLWCADSAPCCF